MMALGFLLLIGITLIADGYRSHVPMGYIYPAMRLSALGRGLKMLAHQGARPGEEKTPPADAYLLKQ